MEDNSQYLDLTDKLLSLIQAIEDKAIVIKNMRTGLRASQKKMKKGKERREARGDNRPKVLDLKGKTIIILLSFLNDI